MKLPDADLLILAHMVWPPRKRAAKRINQGILLGLIPDPECWRSEENEEEDLEDLSGLDGGGFLCEFIGLLTSIALIRRPPIPPTNANRTLGRHNKEKDGQTPPGTSISSWRPGTLRVEFSI